MKLLKIIFFKLGIILISGLNFLKSNIRCNINNNFKKTSTYNVLSFSGGGSFGVVEMGILKKILETENKKYDLYTGISVGGLNAAFLSHYDNINEGIDEVKYIYENIRNKDIYDLFSYNNLSLINSRPLEKTITNVLSKLKDSKKETLIGTTNLYTGKLETFYYNKLSKDDQIKLLLATSAMPIIFQPINFNNNLYVDGAIITNELITEIKSHMYINITFVTPFSTPTPQFKITTFGDVVRRNIEIISGTFNNEILKLDNSCTIPRGEVHMYCVNSNLIKDYSILNFNNGRKLFDIGYNNVESTKYILC
jgi:NTE family protein